LPVFIRHPLFILWGILYALTFSPRIQIPSILEGIEKTQKDAKLHEEVPSSTTSQIKVLQQASQETSAITSFCLLQ
jgi:hypothetical protein